MPDIDEIWSKALPEARKAVTGVGVWAALNTLKPVALEDHMLIVGLPHEATELAGHLKLPHVRRAIEFAVTKQIGSATTIRVIEGINPADWETVKKRDVEARRLQEQQLQRTRAELTARTSWEGVYEQLSRLFAGTPNKSLPQNRAKFYHEALELISTSRTTNPARDDLNERNFARCIERVAQYSDVPSTIVARTILERTGEL